MDETKPQTASTPTWSSTTKLVVALTVVALAATFIVRFQFIITPLLISLILAYLFYPLASFLQRRLHFSWNLSVALIFILMALLLLALLTLSGVGLVQQMQSVITVVQDGLTALPDLIANISGHVYRFGPFTIDTRTIDLSQFSQQVLGMVQPLLSRTGSILSTVAGRTVNFLGWTLFVLLVSYFVLVESGGLRGRILTVEVPGYTQDFDRLGRELGRTWNAFLRGQIIIFIMAVIVYSMILSILGVRYAIGLAFVAGLARFIPYIGPAINWIVLVLVAYFQDFKLFGLEPLYYALLVLGIALIVDQIFDNLVSPRVMSQALKVHPAAVLIAAIVAANLLGILGVVIAAPILATFTLLWNYTLRKMLDLNPWPESEAKQPPPLPGARFLVLLRRFLRTIRIRRKNNEE